ncbi:hypothetical protein RN001_014708 [Aquatica leii]|uniref:Parkin coregulated gene protein homolog n=1 Tax=Aquatica leii TaxID=1421715 RepID=A0AAN7NYC7_9COLE|nr:hypothetical protein RN001_014708 [Aquatica leii]
MVSGKEYRESIRKPLPGAPDKQECRIVPAFTIQSMQKNTCVTPPPKCNVYKERPAEKRAFRYYYQRGDLPIALDVNRSLSWKVDIKKLDYHHYLPMFFEGLCESEHPYRLFALEGINDMLVNGGSKIFPCIPQLIIPIKNALNTKNKKVICNTLQVLQHLVKSADMVGEALVPYYRQILPTLSLYKERNVNIGDAIDYSQMRGENLSDLINETLEILERHGGEDAFINIKYILPTYESCMMN